MRGVCNGMYFIFRKYATILKIATVDTDSKIDSVLPRIDIKGRYKIKPYCDGTLTITCPESDTNH